MTNKDRIIAAVTGTPTDRRPYFFYFGPWAESIERWKTEGLHTSDWANYFEMDEGITTVDVNLGYYPSFDPVLIEDREETQIIIDRLGIKQEIRKKGASIPRYIDYPVKSRNDWEELKKRLDPDEPARFPADWNEKIAKYNQSDAVIQIGEYPYGFFGTLRDMIGVEDLLILFYDDPDLIREMMEYLCNFWIRIYEKVVKDVNIDAIHIWEDMSGKTGSLISPAMVREFMLPCYRKIKQFAISNHIPILSVDTDGNCRQLAPLFFEAGVNLMMPFEVQEGNELDWYVQDLPEMCLMGGFDKKALWTSKEAIDLEFKRLEPVFSSHARFIPAPDHLIPPEVPFELMCYFMKCLKEKIAV